MKLVRCDRCRREYEGKQMFLYAPRLGGSNWLDADPVPWDLCPKCVQGLQHVFDQASRMMRMYLSEHFLQLETRSEAVITAHSLDITKMPLITTKEKRKKTLTDEEKTRFKQEQQQ